MTAPAILIATGNPGKQREMLHVMAGLAIEWKTLDDFPHTGEPTEHGDTFDANARQKAVHYSRCAGLWALADDSGLEVDVLGGEPGVRSARFAGEPSDDAANNRKLIALLQGVPAERRTARFCCAVALADGERILATAQGTVEGVIIDAPRGRNGFGYDPHFFLPDRGVTTAELSPEEKNRISHRGRALAALKPKLTALITQGP